MAAQQYSDWPLSLRHPRTQAWQITLLWMALYQQTLDHCGAVPVPAAQDSSSPCLHPAERKNSLEKGKY